MEAVMAALELFTFAKSVRLGLLLFSCGSKSLLHLGQSALGQTDGDGLLADLAEIVAGLGGNLLASEIQARLDSLPPAQLTLANQHLTRFTGAVLQRVTESVVDDLPRKPDAATLAGALEALPVAWAQFVESAPPEAQPLSGQDFIVALGKVLRNEPAGVVVDPIVLQTFFAVWVRKNFGDHSIRQDLHRDFAQRVGDQLGAALAAALPENHPLAQQAKVKATFRAFAELERFSIAAQKHDDWVKGALIGLHDRLSSVKDDTSALRQHLIPQPVDIIAALDAYAAALERDLSPVPLTQIFDEGRADTIGVQQVFTPLMIRQVQSHDIEHLIHAKEALDYADREHDNDAPQDLQKKKQRIADILSRSPAQPATEVIGNNIFSHYLFLGEPGGGKTLLARHLALRWVQRWRAAQRMDSRYPLHVYVELKHYEDKLKHHVVTDLRGYIISEHNRYGRLPAAVFDQAVRNYALVLILDGLDEVVSSSIKGDITRELCALDNNHYAVILTSRIADFQVQTWHSQHQWRFHRIDPLTPPEQQRFIENYHRAFFPNEEDRHQRITQLRSRLRDFHRLAELAGTPLLLTLICLVNRSGARAETRTELYEQAAELLLHRWDDFHFQDGQLPHYRHLTPLSRSEKHAILRRLAWLIMHGLPAAAEADHAIPCERQHLSANLFPQRLIETATEQVLRETNKENRADYLDVILKVLETRNSVLCPATPGMHSFIHRTFLEFYAAWAWKQEKIPWNDTLPCKDKRWPQRMTAQDRIQHLYHPHWEDSVWRVILILHCARYEDAEEAEEIIRALLAEADDLSTQAERLSAEADRMEKEQQSVAMSLHAQHALLLAAECFSEINGRGRLQPLRDDLRHRLHTLARSSFGIPYTRDDQYRQNLDQRQSALRLLAQLGRDIPETLAQFLVLSAQPDLDPDLRYTCLGELGSLWNDPEALCQHLLNLLGELGDGDGNQNVVLRHLNQQGHLPDLEPIRQQLAFASDMRVLDLGGCAGLRSTKGLPPLPSLQIIDLTDCTGLAGIDALRGLIGLESLRELHLDGCKGLRDTLDLPPLPALETLSMENCTGLEGADALRGLTGLNLLEKLDLTGCSGLRSTEHLPPLPALKTVYLSNCTGLEGADALRGLSGVQNLKELWLDGCIKLRSTQGLPLLPGLKMLHLENCVSLKGTDALRGLAGLDQLEELYLTDCTGLCSTQGLPPLPALKILVLSNCTSLEGPDALWGLTGLKKLEELHLDGCTGLKAEDVEAFRQSVQERRGPKGLHLAITMP